MSKSKEEIKYKSVYEIWEEFLKTESPRKKMDDHQKNIIVASTLHPNFEYNPELLLDMEQFFPYKVIKKRIDVYEIPIKFTPAVYLLLLTMGEAVGQTMINFTYICYMAAKKGQKNIDISFLSTYCYAWGFFTEEQMKKFWLMQKRERLKNSIAGSDNIVDYLNSWEEIFNKLNEIENNGRNKK